MGCPPSHHQSDRRATMSSATVFKVVSFSRLHYSSLTSTVGSPIYQYRSTVHPGYQGEQLTTLVTGTDTRSIYSSRVSGVLVSSQLMQPQAYTTSHVPQDTTKNSDN